MVSHTVLPNIGLPLLVTHALRHRALEEISLFGWTVRVAPMAEHGVSRPNSLLTRLSASRLERARKFAFIRLERVDKLRLVFCMATDDMVDEGPSVATGDSFGAVFFEGAGHRLPNDFGRLRLSIEDVHP